MNNMNDVNEAITFRYKFTFGSGLEKDIDVKLDKETLNLVQQKRASYPKWTELGFNKCPNCSLDEDQHAFCPTAINIVELVDFFRDMISHTEVDVSIQTEERVYSKHTSLQQAISSLVGLYMVTGGCPTMEKLKPMVRYHLPFATLGETQYRVISMYLFAQYFLHRHGKEPDWELKHLVKIYDDIRLINKGFFERLAGIQIKDATLNALVKLDMFASHVSISINKDVLDKMESLFQPYL